MPNEPHAIGGPSALAAVRRDDFCLCELTPRRPTNLYELITARPGKPVIITSNRESAVSAVLRIGFTSTCVPCWSPKTDNPHETLLYRSRDASSSALDDDDQACKHHDAEMDDIRQIFMIRWGDIPV